ncbi:hypothetical protein [Paracidovorax anthurii]|uniref:hypothetical protein n=1 Tax=Paracidovorax anthurii TaxID=78229 RepID=UPI0011BF3F2F|nr:hypothetical protein [Paracidovorax anthurii]
MTRAPTGRPRGSRNRPKPVQNNLVEPAQYDRMRAPIWTTNPAPATRAGADDHKHIASRGWRC